MDVITIESKAYKEIVAKIDVIANYVIIAKTKRTTFQNETYNFHVFSHLQNKGV